MKFDYKEIPTELKELNRWCLWKLQQSKDGRTTKIPVNAKNGYGAKTNDTNTWCSFNEALERCDFYKCDGLGFMLGNGYVGIDIDHALSDDKILNIVTKFITSLNSYTEFSQSKTGIHIITKGTLPVGARRKGNIEMYDNARFFALTGILYEEQYKYISSDKTSELKALWSEYLNNNNNNNNTLKLSGNMKEIPIDNTSYVFTRNNNKYVGSSILSDDEVIAKAKESRNGNTFNCLYAGEWEGMYPSQSEADMAFCSMLAFWCNKDVEQMNRIFQSSGLMRDKWEVKRGQKTYGEMTLENAISLCKDTYSPAITNAQVYNAKTGTVITKKNYAFDDTGNAERFVDRFGTNLHYNYENKCWMIFNGKTWVKDKKQLVKTQADILIDEMKVEAIRENDMQLQSSMLKNVKHLSSSSGKDAMLKEAQHIGDMPVVNSNFNKDLNLLNCDNGVVDLKTGNLLKHSKNYMMTKNTNCKVSFEEPKRWVQFLNEIFDNNTDLVEYVQRVAGYTLTGDTSEQCFFQCFGDGANGKSVFLDILYTALGDYSLNAQVDSILAKGNNSGGANSEIARMDGARFVRTNEPNEGCRFNEGLVKQLVSGDVTTARYLYCEEFEFVPRFKLWIATNYKIQVRGTDAGIWRRMRLIPFKMKFEGSKADKHLTEKLLNELPCILGWMIKGAVKWYNTGLTTPKEIEKENAIYKQEMDIISKFLADCVIVKANAKAKAGEVFAEYKEWAKNGNEYCMTQTKFGIEMSKKFEKTTFAGNRYYLGIMLKKDDTSYVYERME